MIKNMLSTIMGYKRINMTELSKLAGLEYTTVYKIYHDETKGIEFATLNKLCFALDCNVNDIFKYIRD